MMHVFNFEDSLRGLLERNKIRRMRQEAVILWQYTILESCYCSHEPLESYINTISCQITSPAQQQRLQFNFTIEESSYFNILTKSMREAFQEVPVGDDVIKDFVVFSHGGPMAQHSFALGAAVFLQRISNFVKKLYIFKSLDSRQQSQLLQANMIHALMIMFSKLECAKTVEEQFEFFVTAQEMEQLREQSKDGVQLRKASMKHHTPMMACRYKGDTVGDFSVAAQNLNHSINLIGNFELTVIMVILNNFSTIDLSRQSHSLLSNLQLLIERKLSSNITMRQGHSFYWTDFFQSNINNNIQKMYPCCARMLPPQATSFLTMKGAHELKKSTQ